MSAEDDVLAAFGAPRSKPKTKPEPELTPGDEAELEPVGEPAPESESESGPVSTAESESGPESTPKPESGLEPAPESESASEPTSEPDTDDAVDGAPTESEPEPAEGESTATASEPTDEPTEPKAAEADGAVSAAAPLPAPPQDPAVDQPYLDPSVFFAQLQAESAPKQKRRWPRLLLRYVSALAVAGAVGAGTAYAVTIPHRTDIPFLATPGDGRYEFPAAVKPAPPVGKPAPGDEKNTAQSHYSDLRRYLLSPPKGAVAKENGWEPIAEFETAVDSSLLSDHLFEYGLRHIARRGWTTPDGQHTVVELLQFPDHQAAFAVKDDITSQPRAFGKVEDVKPELTVRGLGDATTEITLRVYDAVEGLPGQLARRAVFQTGDVVAIVTVTGPKTANAVALDQEVALQAEMLR